MLNYETLQYFISKTIYIAGVCNVNLHVYQIDEELETYKYVDIRFQDGIPHIKNMEGFSLSDVNQIYQDVLPKKDEILAHSKSEGELVVQSEEELEQWSIVDPTYLVPLST